MGLFGSIGGFFGGDEIGDEIAAQQGYVMGPWKSRPLGNTKPSIER